MLYGTISSRIPDLWGWAIQLRLVVLLALPEDDYVCAHVEVCACVCTYGCVCICLCVCTCWLCAYACMCVHVGGCAYACVCTCVQFTGVFMHTCTYLCVWRVLVCKFYFIFRDSDKLKSSSPSQVTHSRGACSQANMKSRTGSHTEAF